METAPPEPGYHTDDDEKLLHKLGYVRKGHLVAVTRDDLVGENVGQLLERGLLGGDGRIFGADDVDPRIGSRGCVEHDRAGNDGHRLGRRQRGEAGVADKAPRHDGERECDRTASGGDHGSHDRRVRSPRRHTAQV